ncbi:MAG: hypothetical protein JRG97_09470 [Deltaproteobacteria bacterium]|nr:hypothetical protein [Deltaproteobacteria bacterium]MBW2053665.1 hypothetical protein [Deltaproteobacteria bacterium]MBW2141284.1 hypothetical protein [Deltaproteobacteria bacterium]MBW2324790.1 hypothetical protein [Deltaproteobacteria bacterium]
MGALVGGIIALILGLIGLIYWWGYFIKALLAIIPMGLILGGALATYLGIEEWKDTSRRTEDQSGTEGMFDTAESEKERYKAEAEKYKAELEALKTQSAEGEKTEE